jgi:TM2 domain-containing membrane protein YozV
MEVGGKVVCKSCAEKMATQGSTASTTSTVAASAAPAGRKEPILSLILSFFIPGLGQIYNGQLKKGIILVVGYFALMVAAVIIYFGGSTLLTAITFGAGSISFCCCAPLLLIPLVIWLYGMYDAYKVANQINAGEYTKDWL